MIEEIEEIMDESEGAPEVLSDVVLHEVLDLINLALILENAHDDPSSVWITVGTNRYQDDIWFAAIRQGWGCIADIDMTNNGTFKKDGGLVRLQLKGLTSEEVGYEALRQINAGLRNKYAEKFFESKGFKKPAHEPSNTAGFYIMRKVTL